MTKDSNEKLITIIILISSANVYADGLSNLTNEITRLNNKMEMDSYSESSQDAVDEFKQRANETITELKEQKKNMKY
jgi:ElaB/YqjD/DUF883 family membrane-anchored ribosome-binding protein